jgi:hypothetical protein
MIARMHYVRGADPSELRGSRAMAINQAASNSINRPARQQRGSFARALPMARKQRTPFSTS